MAEIQNRAVARLRSQRQSFGWLYQGWSRSRTCARPLANILCPFRALSQRLPPSLSPLRPGCGGQALWRTGCRMFLKVHTHVDQCTYRGKASTMSTVLIANDLNVYVNENQALAGYSRKTSGADVILKECGLSHLCCGEGCPKARVSRGQEWRSWKVQVQP